MGPIAVTVASAIAPYVVSAVCSWSSNAVKTWGPSYTAKATVEASAKAGRKLAGGGDGLLARIGSSVGRAFGWGVAPYAAQSTTFAPEIIAAGITCLGGIVAAGLSNRKVDKNPPQTNQQIDINLLLQVLKQNQQAGQFTPPPMSDEVRWAMYG